jgi:hypothetical protein
MSSGRAGASELLVKLPQPVPPVTHLRGTTMAASLQVLRERGHFDAFWARLPATHQAPIRDLLAASWVEVELGLAYYRALDGLGLPHDEIVTIGKAAAKRVQSAFVSTLIRGMGVVTPATVLSRMDKLWERSFRGGGVQVARVGPKDLRLEVHGAAFLDLRYTRTALMGYYEETLSPTARRVIVRELGLPTPAASAWLVSWV